MDARNSTLTAMVGGLAIGSVLLTTAPASRAYLYYTDEFKHWVPGLGVRIAAKGQE